MNLTENEKRMVYQVESTCQAAILNEIAMNKRYAPNPEIRQTAESLLSKLRLLSDNIHFSVAGISYKIYCSLHTDAQRHTDAFIPNNRFQL